jgi:hypothetical protein
LLGVCVCPFRGLRALRRSASSLRSRFGRWPGSLLAFLSPSLSLWVHPHGWHRVDVEVCIRVPTVAGPDVHLICCASSEPPHCCGCVVVAPVPALVRLVRVPLLGFQRVASPPTLPPLSCPACLQASASPCLGLRAFRPCRFDDFDGFLQRWCCCPAEQQPVMRFAVSPALRRSSSGTHQPPSCKTGCRNGGVSRSVLA